MKFLDGKIVPLFILETQRTESAPMRELTPLERLEGWEEMASADRVCNPRHERGLLHELTAPYLIDWDVFPGEKIVAKLSVRITGIGSVVESIEGPRRVTKWLSAILRPVADGRFLVQATAHLGRRVMLGEDAGDVSGDVFPDVLRSYLNYLEGGDYRQTPCDLTLTELREGGASKVENVEVGVSLEEIRRQLSEESQ
jgi:hypothetical protein